ncbi:MAG: DUF4843 domain-containing protein [Bacteroidales bacterium]|nr:DUF4843 domain-containing protein [Bacteroidales bacterium]
MKRYITLFCLVISLFSMLFVSCEKEPMTYEGKDTIYFDVRTGAEWIDPDLWSHEYYSTVSFGSTVDDVIELNLPVCVSGMPSDIDRSFTIIEVKDSTTVQSGDYEGLESTYTIKAGETKTNVRLVFNRKEHMKDDTLCLQLALQENEYFSLMYKDFGKAPEQYAPDAKPEFDYNHDGSVHNIFVFDVMVKPTRWVGNDATGAGRFGKFSPTKWKFMMKITNTSIEDYASTATMPTARQAAIAQTCANFVMEKAAARTPVLDEDGTMMYFYVDATTVPWSPFTKPSDYYGHDNWTPYEE